MAWPTAQTVVTQAALELGLIQQESDLGTDVFESTDPLHVQLCALLKKAGRHLVDAGDWTQLRQSFGIILGAGGLTWNSYQLPPDWAEMIDQTGWNRSTRLPLGGPLSDQEWQYLASRMTGVVLNVLIKPQSGMLMLYPPSGNTGQQLVMAYKSAWWVQGADLTEGDVSVEWADSTAYKVGQLVELENALEPYVKNWYRCVTPGTSSGDPPGGVSGAGGTTTPINGGTTSLVWNWVGCSVETAQGIFLNFGYGSKPTAGPDRLMFSEELLVSKLKLLWLKAKGFDSNDAEREYNNQLANALGNSPAPILSLSPNRGLEPLLGSQNIPITGFGS